MIIGHMGSLRTIRSLVLNEWGLFASLPRNARLMLGASSVSAFAMPVVSIFVYALILRGTQDVNHVMAFQFALYAAIPCAFVANRFLVGGRLSFAHLYAFGLVLCGAVLAAMTCLAELTWSRTVGMGFLMGLATGLLWANRNYLSLVCTEDRTRNYYFGVESCFYCVGGVVVPAAVGAFLAQWGGAGPDALRAAYRWVAAAALALLAVGAAFLLRGRFPGERPALRVRARYPRVWRKLLLLAILKGTVHIFLTTAPAVLVMRALGGEEGALGLVQSAGALVAAAAMYAIGRATRPHHRVAVLAFALVLYALAASANALFYDRASVLAFMACQLLAQPMFDLSYSPILLGALDAVTGDGRESRYAYIVSHEAGIFAGRVIGAAAFISVACAASGEEAFRYVLALMALLHVLCWPVAESIRRELGWTSR
jgi:YQGE family putative transporter